MRVSKGVAVLQYKKRYRFTGRLTCVVNGRRVSAPKRARIDLLNKIGKRTPDQVGHDGRDKGRFRSSCVHELAHADRSGSPTRDGQRSQVTHQDQGREEEEVASATLGRGREKGK